MNLHNTVFINNSNTISWDCLLISVTRIDMILAMFLIRGIYGYYSNRSYLWKW